MEATGEMSVPRLQLALRLLEAADALAGAVFLLSAWTLMDQIKEKLGDLGCLSIQRQFELSGPFYGWGKYSANLTFHDL